MSHIVRGDFHSEVATKKLLEHNTIDYIRLTIKEATESIDKHLIQLGDTLDRKFLHAVLDFAPTLDGKLNVACHILSPDWEKQNPEYTHLKHLANFYHENLMQPSKLSLFLIVHVPGLNYTYSSSARASASDCGLRRKHVERRFVRKCDPSDP